MVMFVYCTVPFCLLPRLPYSRGFCRKDWNKRAEDNDWTSSFSVGYKMCRTGTAPISSSTVMDTIYYYLPADRICG